MIYAAFAFAKTPNLLIPVFLLYGIYFGLSEPSEKSLVADVVPTDLRGTAFGYYHFVTGLGALPASLLVRLPVAYFQRTGCLSHRRSTGNLSSDSSTHPRQRVSGAGAGRQDRGIRQEFPTSLKSSSTPSRARNKRVSRSTSAAISSQRPEPGLCRDIFPQAACR